MSKRLITVEALAMLAAMSGEHVFDTVVGKEEPKVAPEEAATMSTWQRHKHGYCTPTCHYCKRPR